MPPAKIEPPNKNTPVQPDVSSMSPKRRLLVLAMIMVVACGMGVTITAGILYEHNLETYREQLSLVARGQAHLIEAVAKYDVAVAGNPEHGPAAAARSLERIADAHRDFERIGETGEILLAKREEDRIAYIYHAADGDSAKLPNVPFDSDLAEPMRRALGGASGTMIGLDYGGEKVIAAYEPIGVLGIGVIAKIDMNEIRAPFVRACILSAAMVLAFLLASGLLFARIGNPLILRLEEYSRELEAEVEERTSTEAALRESESRFRRLFENAPICILEIDTAGRLLCMNRAGLDMANVREEESVVGLNYIDSVATEDRPRINEFLEQAYVGIASQFDFKGSKEMGGRLLTATFMPVLDPDGQVDRVLGVSQDVTIRVQAEEASRSSSALLSSVIESPDNVIIFALDRNYRYLSFNSAHIAEMKRVYSSDIKLGQSILSHISLEDDRERAKASFERVLKGDRHIRIEEYGVGDDRTWYELIFNPLHGAGEEITGFTVFVVDVTERRRSSDEKRGLERQVQQAQKLESLGVLAGGIAHDFNNILMSILGNADLALDQLSADSPARTNVLQMETASKRAAGLAQQMLAYSGKGRFVIEPIHLGEFVTEMVHLLEVSISKKAVLEFQLSEDLPTVDGDVTQIRQVIMNLITNASEAVGETSGVIAISTGTMHCDRAYFDTLADEVSIGREEPLPEGEYIYLEVADTGCGMDEESLARIFEPFYSTKFAGRGLGMSATLGIVRGHKGAIKIDSEVGKGTSFKILLPASEPGKVRSKTLGVEPQIGAADWRGSGTILIVDDEDSVRSVGKSMLTRLGFDVLTAKDGIEGIEKLKEHRLETVCVLLDLTMPNMDGEEAFREIQGIDTKARVVLCSGYNQQDATQRFVGKGLAGFLQKPYSLTRLRDCMRETLQDRSPEA